MKALLVNGSPHENGCTFRALKEAEKALNEEGIETEIFQIGNLRLRVASPADTAKLRENAFSTTK